VSEYVAVVDYGLCNVHSVAHAIEECGHSARITDTSRSLEGASHIVLPGVGAFSDAMAELRRLQLDQAIRHYVLNKRRPFLGICLGMQLMAERGDEGGATDGLGLLPGEVRRLVPDSPLARVPHIGWNEVVHDGRLGLLEGVPSATDFYFVHSYHLCPADGADVLARTPYAGGFVSAVRCGLVFGVQFHPEKSQRAGFRVLKNFLAL